MEELFRVEGIYTGKSKPLLGKLKSAISPDQSPEKLIVNRDSVSENEIVNLDFHGGPDRVVHQYAIENFDHLRSLFPENSEKLKPGSLGENVSSRGCDENNIFVGDVIEIGTTVLQVTEPRKPCSTIDFNYGFKGVLKHIARSRTCGWFYRVLEPGVINLGDVARRKEKGPEEFDLISVFSQTLVLKEDKEFLERLARYPNLSERWRERVQKLLDKNF